RSAMRLTSASRPRECVGDPFEDLVLRLEMRLDLSWLFQYRDGVLICCLGMGIGGGGLHIWTMMMISSSTGCKKGWAIHATMMSLFPVPNADGALTQRRRARTVPGEWR